MTGAAASDQVEKREADTAAHISTTQMRKLHALLRDHGITGDKNVHAYLNRWLEEHDREPIDSRAELHTRDAAELIAELEQAEVATAPTAAALNALRAPFPGEAVGKLPRSTCSECSKNRGQCDRHRSKGTCPVCGNWHNTAATIHIDFVGHADVTDRLLQVDPFWSWRPFTTDELQGVPPSFRDGLWIMLTVCGVSRPGFGDAAGGKGAKEAIGDALRNAAMRFGVALDLWAKGDREWSHAEKSGAETMHPDEHAPRERQHDTAWTGPSTAELLAQIDADAARAGVTYEQATRRFLSDNDIDGLAALDRLPPWTIAPLAAAVKKRADEVVAEQQRAATAAAALPAEPDPWGPAPGAVATDSGQPS